MEDHTQGPREHLRKYLHKTVERCLSSLESDVPDCLVFDDGCLLYLTASWRRLYLAEVDDSSRHYRTVCPELIGRQIVAIHQEREYHPNYLFFSFDDGQVYRYQADRSYHPSLGDILWLEGVSSDQAKQALNVLSETVITYEVIGEGR